MKEEVDDWGIPVEPEKGGHGGKQEWQQRQGKGGQYGGQEGQQRQGVVLSSFSIVNKSATPVNANLYLQRNNNNYSLIPVNTPIYGNDMYPRGIVNEINMDSGDRVVLLVTGGNVDYTFSYNPIK